MVYAGTATFYDPPPEARHEMRAAARRVGDGLRERIGFRGAFTVDGVITVDGFLPTELNPRSGAGLMPLGAALPALPLHLLHLAARDDQDFEARPAELERLVVEAADHSRRGAAYTDTRVTFTETLTHRVVYDGNECRVAAAGEQEDATITIGPSNVGGFVRIAPDLERTPAGPSIAPLAIAGFTLADREWATGIGPIGSKP
jgi:biotin carboxylase